jgi:hypothetical protein
MQVTAIDHHAAHEAIVGDVHRLDAEVAGETVLDPLADRLGGHPWVGLGHGGAVCQRR